MGLALEIGVFLRARHQKRLGDVGNDGLGTVDGAVFGLMGLLLAFVFSGAASRFDHRRDLIVEEANAIGTAYLRVDLLLPDDQPALRQKFRDYVDSRLDLYQDLEDESKARAKLQKCLALQAEIWDMAVAGGARTKTTYATMLLLPALNDMIDIVTTRSAEKMKHPPLAIWGLLSTVLLLCAMLAGYRIGDSSHVTRLHKTAFVLVLAITAYVIVDLEYPRLGRIRVDSHDMILVDVRDAMR
jgi:hypothetical protein